MNIGITCAPTVGGSGAVAAALGVQLAQRGHDVHFVTERLPFHLGEFRDNINVHEAEVGHPGTFDQAPTGLALAAKMAEVAREHRLEVLHVHYAIPYSITGFLARQIVGESAPKLITTLHGTDITLVGQDRSFYEITRFGIEHSDGVTAVSHFLRAMTQDELKVSRQIEVVPNFVDLTECCPDRAYSGTERLAEAGHALLLHTSTLRPGNRVLDLIRILERVNAEVPATLLVVGDGPERAAAQALARRCGVADRVRFVGRVESLPEIMAAAQLFLLPSELESFGLTALEAMACGVPVVGTDTGGLPEVVQHAETGFLLPVGDVEGMAARCIELLQDTARREQMGQAGRRRAASLFGADRVVSAYERFYEKTLAS